MTDVDYPSPLLDQKMRPIARYSQMDDDSSDNYNADEGNLSPSHDPIIK